MHLMAGIAYGGDRMEVPQNDLMRARLGLARGTYVTVHNGFDTDFVITGRRATKCYPHFGAVVARLKRQLPGVTFVQIGTTTSAPIDACDLVLLHQTTLDEASGLIAGAALHLDNEGGMVHLAACLGTRSAVLFGPTPSDYFGYPGNLNFDPPVCGNCWWTKRSWMDVCAKGYETPLCLSEQDPDMVAQAIYAALRGMPVTEPTPDRAALEATAAD
jgi:ADP-heptose:LPS heptosyltransferase